jgi:hypothetical protein
MSQNKFFVVIDSGATATVYSYRNASLAAAAAAELGGVAATDSNLKDVETRTLVKLHNELRPDRPVTKFSDRATAEKRLRGALEVLAKAGPQPASVPKRVSSGERPGRVSEFSGKVIRKLVEKNPRKEGTKGFESWSVLRDGMTYDKYIEAGGRRQDLAWDLAHKWVKMEAAPKE